MKYYVYKYVVDNEIIYIGLTNDIARRVYEHSSGEGIEEKFLPYLANSVVYYHQCGNEVEMQALEKLLINIYKPMLNVVDVQDGDSTIVLEIDWTIYEPKNFDERDMLFCELRALQKNIASNETRILEYQDKVKILQAVISRRRRFYEYLDKHKESIAGLPYEYFGLDEDMLPGETAIQIGNKRVNGWYDEMKKEADICWVKFSPQCLMALFSESSQPDWVDITIGIIGGNKVEEVSKRIKNLRRRNMELESKKEAINKKLSEVNNV